MTIIKFELGREKSMQQLEKGDMASEIACRNVCTRNFLKNLRFDVHLTTPEKVTLS